MFIKLIKPLDTLQADFPSMRMFVVADDVRLGFQHRDEENLAVNTLKATERSVQLLEEDEHMEVSRGAGGKTIALASTSALRNRVRGRLGRAGIVMRKESKNLGVDLALHKGGK